MVATHGHFVFIVTTPVETEFTKLTTGLQTAQSMEISQFLSYWTSVEHSIIPKLLVLASNTLLSYHCWSPSFLPILPIFSSICSKFKCPSVESGQGISLCSRPFLQCQIQCPFQTWVSNLSHRHPHSTQQFSLSSPFQSGFLPPSRTSKPEPWQLSLIAYSPSQASQSPWCSVNFTSQIFLYHIPPPPPSLCSSWFESPSPLSPTVAS